MKIYTGLGGRTPRILNLGASLFNPGKGVACSLLIGGWVSSRTRLDTVEKKNISWPLKRIESRFPRPPVRSLVPIHTELS
jgi:hypothetical protein